MGKNIKNSPLGCDSFDKMNQPIFEKALKINNNKFEGQAENTNNIDTGSSMRMNIFKLDKDIFVPILKLF